MEFIAILNAAESSKCAIKIRLLHVLTDSEKWQEKERLNCNILIFFFNIDEWTNSLQIYM